MKYILSLLLGLTPVVWGMEEAAATGEETRQQLVERRVGVAGLKVSYSTCLNTNAQDGYSLSSTLEIRRNCLKHFAATHITEIEALRSLGLFKGEISSYSEEAMSILHGIFSNDNKENLPRSIPGDFLHHPTDFINDLINLRNLIKGINTQSEQIKSILETMRADFIRLNWMIVYYQNHLDEYKVVHQ